MVEEARYTQLTTKASAMSQLSNVISSIPSDPSTLFLWVGLFLVVIAVIRKIGYQGFEINLTTKEARLIAGAVGIIFILLSVFLSPKFSLSSNNQPSQKNKLQSESPKSIERSVSLNLISKKEFSDEVNSIRIGNKTIVSGGDVGCGSASCSRNDADRTIQLWQIKNQELNRIKTFREADTRNVLSVAISSDDTILASGGKDNIIRVWNLVTGKSYARNNHTDWVTSIAISRDNKYLVSGSYDNTVKVWDLNNEIQLLSDSKKVPGGHSDNVVSVAISPDSQYVFSGSKDKTINVWKLNNGQLEQPRTLKGNPGTVWSLDVSPDGETLVSGSQGNTVKIWKWKDEKKSAINLLRNNKYTVCPLLDEEILPLPADCFFGDVNTVAISLDGKMIAAGSDDGTISLWELETGNLLTTGRTHRREVWSVTFDPNNNQRLLSSGADYYVRLWQLTKRGT